MEAINSQQAGKIYFASESVGEGHPDKLCDQISDGILDACIKVDPNAKVAMESATKTGMVSGEVSANSFCSGGASGRDKRDQGAGELRTNRTPRLQRGRIHQRRNWPQLRRLLRHRKCAGIRRQHRKLRPRQQG